MSRKKYDSESGTLILIDGWRTVDHELSTISNNPVSNHVVAAELQKIKGTTTSQTLAARSTSVTFNVPTTGDNLIKIYTLVGIDYKSINTSTAGQVTVTFKAQPVDVTVYCNIREVS